MALHHNYSYVLFVDNKIIQSVLPTLLIISSKIFFNVVTNRIFLWPKDAGIESDSTQKNITQDSTVGMSRVIMVVLVGPIEPSLFNIKLKYAPYVMIVFEDTTFFYMSHLQVPTVTKQEL